MATPSTFSHILLFLSRRCDFIIAEAPSFNFTLFHGTGLTGEAARSARITETADVADIASVAPFTACATAPAALLRRRVLAARPPRAGSTLTAASAAAESGERAVDQSRRVLLLTGLIGVEDSPGAEPV